MRLEKISLMLVTALTVELPGGGGASLMQRAAVMLGQDEVDDQIPEGRSQRRKRKMVLESLFSERAVKLQGAPTSRADK